MQSARSRKPAGTPIGSNDLLIAAQAYATGPTIVAANADEFERIRGLKGGELACVRRLRSIGRDRRGGANTDSRGGSHGPEASGGAEAPSMGEAAGSWRWVQCHVTGGRRTTRNSFEAWQNPAAVPFASLAAAGLPWGERAYSYVRVPGGLRLREYFRAKRNGRP